MCCLAAACQRAGLCWAGAAEAILVPSPHTPQVSATRGDVGRHLSSHACAVSIPCVLSALAGDSLLRASFLPSRLLPHSYRRPAWDSTPSTAEARCRSAPPCGSCASPPSRLRGTRGGAETGRPVEVAAPWRWRVLGVWPAHSPPPVPSRSLRPHVERFPSLAAHRPLRTDHYERPTATPPVAAHRPWRTCCRAWRPWTCPRAWASTYRRTTSTRRATRSGSGRAARAPTRGVGAASVYCTVVLGGLGVSGVIGPRRVHAACVDPAQV